MSAECPGMDWLFGLSAPALSTLSGVAGGFVFAGTVLLLGERHRPRRIPTLSLFWSSLFALLIGSFLFGLLSGERICMRASTEGVVASGILEIGAVGRFGGLSWLMNAYVGTNQSIARLSQCIGYGIEVLVFFMLSVTTRGFIRDLHVTHHLLPPGWLSVVVTWYAAAMSVIVVAVALTRPKGIHRMEAAAFHASLVSLIYVMASVLVYGIIASYPRPSWDPVATSWLVYLGVAASLVLPALTLTVHARAIPRW